ncbi:HtaA domain-containing protein [Streptomyces sp. NBC_01236]|uniref:HtaA domain-containing protein n=1 Tax=Streptomyces sp. NBC_01236 TaxID=2903789 RepID=UPI002E15BE07
MNAAFEGAVRFTGDNGLDLRLGNLRTTVKDGKGTLYADVTGPDFTGKKVPLVTFAARRARAWCTRWAGGAPKARSGRAHPVGAVGPTR